MIVLSRGLVRKPRLLCRRFSATSGRRVFIFPLIFISLFKYLPPASVSVQLHRNGSRDIINLMKEIEASKTKRNFFKQNSFARNLLKALATSGMILVAATNPYFGFKLARGINRELSRKKWRQFYNDLYKQRGRGWIDILQRPDGSYEVTLTAAGTKIIKKFQLDDLKIKKPERWDGSWRMVAFDIPSKNPKSKLARNALLSKLKELGFVMVQKSLWTHPYECRDEIMVIAEAFEVKPYIHFFVARELEREKEIREKFEKFSESKLT